MTPAPGGGCGRWASRLESARLDHIVDQLLRHGTRRCVGVPPLAEGPNARSKDVVEDVDQRIKGAPADEPPAQIREEGSLAAKNEGKCLGRDARVQERRSEEDLQQWSAGHSRRPRSRGCGSPSEENSLAVKIHHIPHTLTTTTCSARPFRYARRTGVHRTHRHRRATAPASIHHSPPTHSSAQLPAHSYESTVIIALAQSQSRRGRSPTLPPCCPPAVAPGPRLSPGRAVSGRWGHARTHLTPETPSARCS